MTVSSPLRDQLQEAQALCQVGKLPEAQAVYYTILAQYPNNAEALSSLALISASQGALEEAITLLKKAIKHAPDEALYYNNLGVIYTKHGKIKDARAQYAKAITLKPDYAQAYNNLGNLDAREQNWPLAQVHYEKALMHAPTYPDASYNLGLLYFRQENLEVGKKHLVKAITDNPQMSHAHYTLAQIYYLQQRLQESAACYERALALNPTSADILIMLGVIYFELNDYEMAENAFLKVLQWGVEDARVYDVLGDMMLKTQQPQRALVFYDKQWKLAGDSAAIHQNIAACHLMLQNKTFAIEHYEKALAVSEPHEQEALNYMLGALKQDTKLNAAPMSYLKKLFDRYAGHYETHLKETLHYAVPELLYKALSRFVTMPEKKWYMADLGCGTGLSGHLFKPHAAYFVGVDIAEQMLVEAKKQQCYDNYEQANNLEFLKKHSNQFDVILAGDVFLYTGELTETLTACWNALKKGGFLAFTTEQTQTKDVELTPMARFCHHPDYIRRIAKDIGYHILCHDEITPRIQAGKPVLGSLFILKRES